VEDVLAGSFLDQLPARLIGDKAYDSDPLDQKLATEYNIEMIARTGAAADKRLRTDASSGDIAEDGKWNGSSHGCRTSADSPRDGNTTSKTSSASFISLAST